MAAPSGYLPKEVTAWGCLPPDTEDLGELLIKSDLLLHPEKEAQLAAAENKLRECLALHGTLGSLEVPGGPHRTSPLPSIVAAKRPSLLHRASQFT